MGYCEWMSQAKKTQNAGTRPDKPTVYRFIAVEDK
jgi:hypothetical protein